MIKDVVMPKAGLTMIEGTIVEWLVPEGSRVKKGDALMEYENEKSVQTCDARNDGFLHITAGVGETIPIGEKIGLLAETQEEYALLVSGTAGGEKSAVNEKISGAETSPSEEKNSGAEIPEKFTVKTPSSGKDGHVRASGLARKMAAEAGIDLADVPAPSGRVQKKDIEAYLKSRAASSVFAAPTPASVENDEITEIPWIGVRKTVATNMFKSLQTTAQCTCVRELDATPLLELRAKLADCAETLGCKISVNDLLCMMLAKILLRHPLANATYDGKNVSTHSHVHLSVAVATEHGLMVPVVKNIDTLSLTEIHHCVKNLAQQAKDRTLPPGSQAGGTCTITNYGVFPIDFATPVVNAPQTCIIGFGRTSLKPAILPDGTVGAREMMSVAFTFDHQVFDGYSVGKILEDIEKFMKVPEMILA